MRKVLSAEEMREVDRLTTEKYGIPSVLLMENAAHAAAQIISDKLGGSVKGKSFLILCGKGNNGGDGAALARILWMQGADVTVALTANPKDSKGDARINFEALLKIQTGLIYDEPQINLIMPGALNTFFDNFGSLVAHDVIVDAFFGTGLTRKLEGDIGLLGKMLASMDEEDKTFLTFAIDMPSGLNSDTPELIGDNFCADATITFTTPKLANVLPPASNFNGELHIANIGSPQELIDNSPSQIFLAEKEDAKKWLEQTKFSNDSYKNKRGSAFIIAGSKKYSGAAVLAGNGAIQTGVGLVTVATPESALNPVSERILPEVIVNSLPETENGLVSEEAFSVFEKSSEKSDVIAIGCGLGQIGGNATARERASNKYKKNFVYKVVANRNVPVVVDADGLNALAPFDLAGSEKTPLILTPHEGEFLRLLAAENKSILDDRIKAVRDFSRKHKVILVLKGERVLLAEPNGKVVINPTGNSGLGKAGNGDNLTGILAGFIAQAVQMDVDIFETVVAAVYIAGLAGDIAAEKLGKRAMLASDVRECLIEALKEIERA